MFRLTDNLWRSAWSRRVRVIRIAARRESDRVFLDVVDETIPDADLSPATLRLNGAVVDEEIQDRGRTVHRWTGTPEQLAACAAVNPFTARMFQIADRVLLRGQWVWLRKTDGAVLEVDNGTR